MKKNPSIHYICIGASNPEIIRTIRVIEKQHPQYKCEGFIDRDPAKQDIPFYGYPVYDDKKYLRKFIEKGYFFCNMIASNTPDKYLSSLALIRMGGKLINLVHPDVNLDMVHMGTGNYIQERVVLQAEVSIGDDCCIQAGTFIGHQGTIGNTVLIAPGCTIASFAVIEEGVYIGAGVTSIPRVKIGKWSIIGAGTVLIHDVPPYSVVVGNPGRIIHEVDKKIKRE